jgi:hypothetical protein
MELKHQPGAAVDAPRQVTSRRFGPRARARTAGVFYVLEGAASAFGALHVVSEVTVSGNGAATAANVLTHQPLMWLGFAFALVAVACHVVYTVLFYELFRPVSRTLSLVAAAISLVAAAIQAGSALFQAAPLLILRSGGYLNVFAVRQRDALALAFLKLNMQAFDIYLVFFGLWLAVIGYLIVRSTFIPTIVGVLAACAGLCYLVLLAPPLATYLYPYYLAPDVIGEPVLLLWLLIVGLNPDRWQQQAAAAAGAATG